MERKIPVILISSNPDKAKIARLNSVSPIFDEPAIQRQLEPNRLGLSFLYPLIISRMKIEEQRIKSEQPDQLVLITSDSVVCVRDDQGRLVPINRDDDPEIISWANERIKGDSPLIFVGGVSFGRNLPDYPIYSFLSYFKIQSKEISLPIDIQSIPDYSSGFSYGIIDPEGKFIETGKDNFQKGRPHISGLLSEVIKLAEEYADLYEAENLVRYQIANFPFNTCVFYQLINQGYSYEQIVSGWKKIFKENGGNCSFHSLYLAEQLTTLEFSPKIGLFSSLKPDHEKGHSGIFVGNFFFDPGLSIPFPIIFPNNSESNFVPFSQPMKTTSGKTIYFSEHGLRLQKNGNTGGFFSLREIIDPDAFIERLPAILIDLHPLRKIAKIDWHDEYGNRIKRELMELNH